jgi:hypothetical protein
VFCDIIKFVHVQDIKGVFMAIDLNQEKKRFLSTQDMYDIISFSVAAAEDNGFMNSFILNRALYEYAAIMIHPELKEKYGDMIAENINKAWDAMLEDEIFDELGEEYATDMEMLAENGRIWVNEYTRYSHSVRGLLNNMQLISGDILDVAAQKLKTTVQEEKVDDILGIAKSWGMDNVIEMDRTKPVSEDSVFE